MENRDILEARDARIIEIYGPGKTRAHANRPDNNGGFPPPQKTPSPAGKREKTLLYIINTEPL